MKQNKELIHYLDSGVVVEFDNKVKGVLVGYQPQKILFDLIVCEYDGESFDYKGWCSDDTVPYLYPLYCLTETINHEGVDEIPLVELAKIEGTYKGEDYDFVRDILVWLNSDNKEILFRYSPTYQSFYKTINGNLYQSTFQLALFQYLFSRRINLFPNLEAIDPRKCEINPYLITKK